MSFTRCLSVLRGFTICFVFSVNRGDVSTSVFLVWCQVGFVVNFGLILAVLGLEQASEVLGSFLDSLVTSAYLVHGAVNILVE